MSWQLTLTTMFEYVPTCAVVGVPVNNVMLKPCPSSHVRLGPPLQCCQVPAALGLALDNRRNRLLTCMTWVRSVALRLASPYARACLYRDALREQG